MSILLMVCFAGQRFDERPQRRFGAASVWLEAEEEEEEEEEAECFCFWEPVTK